MREMTSQKMSREVCGRSAARVWPLVVATLAVSACSFGDDTELASPYETADISIASALEVADGATPVEVMVTGEPGVELILAVSGASAAFLSPDASSAQQKTVFLAASEADPALGQATARVVGGAVGRATVTLKADPARTAREIEFTPVRMAVGAPTPARFQPGLVVHDVCVATNSPVGAIRADSITAGDFGPVRRDVQAQMPEAGCPETTVDELGWRGYAAFSWGTAVDVAQVTVSYVGAGDEALAQDILTLRGSGFPGYEVTASAPQTTPSFTSIELSIAFPAVAPLAGGPAAGVQIENIRFIPEGGPAFLGSSSGGAEDTPVTGIDGKVELLFGAGAQPGTYALLVTPAGGATVHITDLTVP